MLNDWHLTYGNTDFAFGTVDSKFVFPQSAPPEISAADIKNDDTDTPRGDGLLFGRDFRGGQTITINAEVVADTEVGSLTLLQRFANAWRADSVRDTPGAMAQLTSHTGRTVFGRPRRFQQKLDLLPFGVTAVACDFAAVDDLWYGPPQVAEVRLAPAPGGGLVAPLAAPLSTTSSSDRSQSFTVGGLMPIWPTITISGPITSPSIEVVGQFRMDFVGLNLSASETLTIDTRPWARTVMRNGASVAGRRDPRTSRLSEASVPPGTHELALRGTSATGTPRALVTWRDAFPTM